MINAPEENDIEKKRQLYEQVKIDPKVFDSIKPIPSLILINPKCKLTLRLI